MTHICHMHAYTNASDILGDVPGGGRREGSRAETLQACKGAQTNMAAYRLTELGVYRTPEPHRPKTAKFDFDTHRPLHRVLSKSQLCEDAFFGKPPTRTSRLCFRATGPAKYHWPTARTKTSLTSCPKAEGGRGVGGSGVGGWVGGRVMWGCWSCWGTRALRPGASPYASRPVGRPHRKTPRNMYNKNAQHMTFLLPWPVVQAECLEDSRVALTTCQRAPPARQATRAPAQHRRKRAPNARRARAHGQMAPQREHEGRWPSGD